MSKVSSPYSYQQYSKISIGNEVYKEKDAVIVNSSNDVEVAIINYIYESHDEHLLNITKYIFAKNLKKLFKKQALDFDKNNEVVQDLSQSYNVLLKQVVKKCTIVILCVDENAYYIKENNLNPSVFFSCRFCVKGEQLFPLITETVIRDHLLNTPSTKFESPKKSKMESENTPVVTVNNNIEIYLDNDYLSPTHRNQVKRNLNKSFGNSPLSQEKSILNYSIESLSDEDEDRLVLKLRVSKKAGIRNTKKRNAVHRDSTIISPPKIRKSTRNVTRKSYADYVSPEKVTPSKRHLRSTRMSDDEFDPKKNKISRSTPRKENSNNATDSKNITPSKRESRPPTRFIEEISPVNKTPHSTRARRSLKLTKAEESNSPSKSTRSSVLLKTSNQDDDLGIIENSSNLDDSLRTNLLKNNFKLLKLDENNKSDSDNEDDNAKNDNVENALRTDLLKDEFKMLKLDENNKHVTINSCKSKYEDDNIKKKKLDDSFFSKVIKISLEKLSLSDNNKNDSSYSDSLSNSEEESTPKKRRHTSSTVPRTPKNVKTVSKTPSSTRSSKATPSRLKQTPKTSKNRARLIREGVVTPSMQERSNKIKGNTTPLMQARSQLHVSYVPESLPCREKEFCDIYNFVEGKLLDGCGGCMYISGVPGTGKTATVTSVIKHLQENKDVPNFNFVNLNGMRLTEPRQSYVEILKQLNGKTVSWEQAQNTLEEMFIKVKKLEPVVMLIDELDILCTKRQDVVYNLLDWPTKAKNQLVVISIANTMDLPERLLMNRVTSRLGLTRLTFQAYSFKQLQEIVTKRLCGTNSFNSDVVQFVARKVASVSGDARRALDICRRAAELAESEGKSQLVSMDHVNQALNDMITQPKVLAIRSCTTLEQLILQSIVAEVERTGVEETTFYDVYKMLITCAAIEGFKIASSTVAQSAVCRLGACKLILVEQKCSNIYQKIILNVSVDDVYYALQKKRS